MCKMLEKVVLHENNIINTLIWHVNFIFVLSLEIPIIE